MISRALVSVSDRTGLADFARGLGELGAQLVASDGTAAHLRGEGIEVRSVDELTKVPELLGGRVKTLHPGIHAGILAREADDSELREHGIEPFDLVCVNLYPFEELAAREGTSEQEAVEAIDIGGPALLRGAAKNHARVAPVCRPDQYGPILEELREAGELSVETRRRLAGEAFMTSAHYEAAIARWFSRAGDEVLPERFAASFTKWQNLAYGENPHQPAAYYVEAGARRHLLSQVTQLHGRELSLVNLLDLSAGRMLLREFTRPICVIVKHATPCGVAVAASIEEAYERAVAGDPESAFGMTCVLNRPVRAGLAELLKERFVDVLFAPAYEEEALATLSAKPDLRILLNRERRGFDPDERDLKRVVGGVLVQQRDWATESRREMQVVCGEPSDTQWEDLLLAWRVCKHAVSNAIVIVRAGRTIGIGAGQTSRLEAVRIAVESAGRHGHDLHGAVLASDGFFPFADGPETALDAGVRAVIQPGGSKRDDEVIAAVSEVGAAMVFTGRRHFRH